MSVKNTFGAVKYRENDAANSESGFQAIQAFFQTVAYFPQPRRTSRRNEPRNVQG